MSKAGLHRRVSCPKCGKQVAVTNKGRLNPHLDETGERCDGSLAKA